jgi:hypothetical protein
VCGTAWLELDADVDVDVQPASVDLRRRAR